MERPLQVLLVDDEPRVTSALTRAVRSLQPTWKLQVANNGHDALLMISDSIIDVVVTDMRMPNMSGSELIREIQFRYPWILRIMLSGIVDPSLVTQAQRWQRYLFKPCPPERIVLEIQSAISNRDHGGALIPKHAAPSKIPRILVVDDSHGGHDLLHEVFATLSNTIDMTSTHDGLNGLEAIYSKSPMPHIVVLNLPIHAAQGLDILLHYRKHTDHPSPIVILTPDADAAKRSDIILKGAAFCETTPLVVAECKLLVNRLALYAQLTAASWMEISN
jgi:CheY-like chemotaxis protein